MTFTVKATQSGSPANGMILRVKVLTGAAAASAQAGATAVQSGAAAHQASITTTVTGSQVYASAIDVGATALTANGNTTQFDDINPGDSIHHGTGRSASATGTPGAITIGWSAPAASGLCSLLEILPNGTITEDASGPAVASALAQTVTTAAFQPPAGSLLVAMTSSNGGAGTVSIAMSDTSGLGLTWIAGVTNHPTGGGSAYVFYAQVPFIAGRPYRFIPNITVPVRGFSRGQAGPGNAAGQAVVTPVPAWHPQPAPRLPSRAIARGQAGKANAAAAGSASPAKWRPQPPAVIPARAIARGQAGPGNAAPAPVPPASPIPGDQAIASGGSLYPWVWEQGWLRRRST